MRYFAEHGATVVRIESRSRPDFLRTYGIGPGNPCGLEGSDMFDALNVGKLSVTLNLKHPEGVALAKRLVQWTDAVAENFAPRAMRGFGLDYASMVTEKPDLVMVSSCLQGQTGPHKDYPGFGGQGSALGGYNLLTGWPDREPVGPFGTITDSLAPRFVASALAAGLLYRRRTGQGVHLDVAQVEAAVYSLSPWVLDYDVNGHIGLAPGQPLRPGRAPRRLPLRRRGPLGGGGGVGRRRLGHPGRGSWASTTAPPAGWPPSRPEPAAVDEVEALVSAWTATRAPADVAAALQARGARGRARGRPGRRLGRSPAPSPPPLRHPGTPVHGGVRLRAQRLPPQRRRRRPSRGSSPTLGEHNEYVLGEILGVGAAEQRRLLEDGVLE